MAKLGRTPISASIDILLGRWLYCKEKHIIGDNPTFLCFFKFPALDFEATECL
jgi:hypothetical protein